MTAASVALRVAEWALIIVPLYVLAIWAAYDIRLYAIKVFGRVIQ